MSKWPLRYRGEQHDKNAGSPVRHVVVSSRAGAEPVFLAKQYTRCTACHYSPTGGGLLTPYGRLLSHRELSTTGGETAPSADATDAPHGEQSFLNGLLGDALGPVHLGLEMRPSHLRIGFPGGHQDLNLLMNLDLVGAVQKNGWTAYGTIGREPPHAAVRAGRTQSNPAFISYEHWLSYQTGGGFGIRAGRFLPAYGVRFADHTIYTRAPLDLDRNDQVYGIEVSDTVGSSLVQVMSPARRRPSFTIPSGAGSLPRAAGNAISGRAQRSSARACIAQHGCGSAIRVGRWRVGIAPTSRVSIGRKWTASCRRRPAGARGSWPTRRRSRSTAAAG